jgi:uncharacterized protein YjbJ (UPF0337 family)
MTDTLYVLCVLIPTIPALIAAVGGWRNHQAIKEQAVKISDVHDSLQTVKVEINGKMQQLLSVTGDAREAVGMLAGRADQANLQVLNDASGNAREALGMLAGRADKADLKVLNDAAGDAREAVGMLAGQGLKVLNDAALLAALEKGRAEGRQDAGIVLAALEKGRAEGRAEKVKEGGQ